MNIIGQSLEEREQYFHDYMQKIGERAKRVTSLAANLTAGEKNAILSAFASSLENRVEEILSANARDLDQAVQTGMSESMQDRLRLDTTRIHNICQAIGKIIALEDPIGIEERGWLHPKGMRIRQVRVPIGVVGIIYEARPNVTVDAACLCIKSGNVVILRGGKEALHTNMALVKIMRDTLEAMHMPVDLLQLLEHTDRSCANIMLRLNAYIDVLIPRGSKQLIQTVVQNSSVPVIETGAGVCHVYVDSCANLAMAVNIVNNAKTQRPSVCNAIETLLVHKAIAEELLPMVKAQLDEHAVVLHGCANTRSILGDTVLPTEESDYDTEYLGYAMSIRVVESLSEAVEHIARHSTKHSECIVTESQANADYFFQHVDSAAVYQNVSTRFTDGEEFGFGAEIGISTQKLHARGPMGLQALTTVQYRIVGNGQIRN